MTAETPTSIDVVSTTLPIPGAVEREHSDRVAAALRREIERAGGWIGFAPFMEFVLYTPGLGYYSAGARKFGEAGDFITAPELSPLYARCLARQCMDILDGLNGGDILEVGAGSGVLAAELLLELERRGRLPRHYLILEISADLRQRQRQTIRELAPQLASRVGWLERLPGCSLSGIVLANEVVDALPAERFVIGEDGVLCAGVCWKDGVGPAELLRPADARLREAVERVQEGVGRSLPPGYHSEIHLDLPAWLAGLSGCLQRGVMLFVDYGLPRREYYHAQRSRGTLLCHYRHRAHEDPYRNLGIQDITAWVDFTALAEAALTAELTVAGYTTQAQFLIGNGLEEHIADIGATELQGQLELARQARILTLPGEMGEKFKVMALTRDYGRPMRGFALRDLRTRL